MNTPTPLQQSSCMTFLRTMAFNYCSAEMIVILLVTVAVVSVAVAAPAVADVRFKGSPQAGHHSTRHLRHNRLRSHSTYTDDYVNTPYYYGNYGNNIQHPHQYFYEWPDRDYSSFSYSPTSSPTDGSIIPTYMPTTSDHAAYHSRIRSFSTRPDKPTTHPTTLDYFNSPYYYGYYGNNAKHPHQHFYEWPDRDPSSFSYSPTTSPTDGSIIPTYMPTASQTRSSSPTGEWDVLTHEHFLHGFGVFQEVESQDINHYSSTFGRRGVIQLKQSSTLPSYNIAVDSSQLKVEFSFYSNSMGVGEGFCLAYSLNEETDWNSVRCWQSSIDFENSEWHDDFNAELNLDSNLQVDSLRIKFESIASRDNVDVMFDRVTLLQFR